MHDVGQVMKVRLSCCLVLLSNTARPGGVVTAPPWLDPYLIYIYIYIYILINYHVHGIAPMWISDPWCIVFFFFSSHLNCCLFLHSLCLFVTYFHIMPLLMPHGYKQMIYRHKNIKTRSLDSIKKCVFVNVNERKILILSSLTFIK